MFGGAGPDDIDQPTGATVMALFGGVLTVIGGYGVLYGSSPTLTYFYLGLVPWGGSGFIGVVGGLVTCGLALLMYALPRWHLVCGVSILVLAVLSVFGGGELYGLLFGLIGGGYAAVFVPPRPLPPELAAPPVRPLASGLRICSSCESPLPPGASVCENCGRPVAT